MSISRTFRLLTQALLVLVCSADILGCAKVDIPTAPDVGPFRQAFAHPTGILSQETIATVIAASSTNDARLASGALAEAISHLVIPKTEDSGQSKSVAGVKIRGEGYLNVTQVCPGWGDGPSGQVELTLPVREDAIERVVWGQAEACRFKLDKSPQSRPFELNGEIIIDLGGRSDDPEFGQELLILIDIVQNRLGAAFHEAILAVRFRAGETDALFFLDGFSYVLRLLETGQARIEAANGVFICDVHEQVCYGEGGNFSW